MEIEGTVYEYSFVDAANPVVFVRAEQFGLEGTELPWEFEARPDCAEICRRLEIIRGTCAVKIGLAKDLADAAVNSQTLPKIAICTTPKTYTAGSKKVIEAGSVDFVGRLFSLGMKMIQAYMGTGGICTVVAANTPGTIVNEIVCAGKDTDQVTTVRIGHPFGIMEVDAELEEHPDGGTHGEMRYDRKDRKADYGRLCLRERLKGGGGCDAICGEDNAVRGGAAGRPSE